MNAKFVDENTVYSLKTDKLIAKEDYEAKEKVKEIANRLNQKYKQNNY